VAHTTPTSEWRTHPIRDGKAYKLFFGRRVPEGVTAVNTIFDHNNDQLLVRWRIKGDPDIHEMPFTQTDEGVMAALTAMKLTC
jgi:hypothetical protein